MDDKQPVRVAVVGTGLAGLTTAYLLKNDKHRRYDVTLLDQTESLSFDSASITVKNEKTGDVERVDLPMRASAGGYYANLMRMYRHLNVPLHPIRFLFIFSEAIPLAAKGIPTSTDGDSEGGQQRSYFVHASNLHQLPPPWPSQRSVLLHIIEIMYLIICQLWFSVACFIIVPNTTGPGGGESFAEYLERIWMPRRDIVNYKRLSHGHQHYAVCGGVSQIQAKLSNGLDGTRLGSRVSRVAPAPNLGGVLVRWKSNGSTEEEQELFDRVVLAVSPDVASRIFAPLAAIAHKMPTVQVESSVLPMTKENGYSVVHKSSEDGVSAGCMHHSKDGSRAQTIMLKTRFSNKGSQTEALHTMPSGVIVSTCPIDSTGPPKNAIRYAKFTRTLRTPQSRAAVEKMMGRAYPDDDTNEKLLDDDCDWTNGDDNVWIAGAWCWDGMVLLEGCVVSAMKVARDFGVEIPWALGSITQAMSSSSSRDIGLAFMGGFIVAVFTVSIAGILALRRTDVYGLGHWKLNAKMPLSSMWMNLGYWTTPDGKTITVFEDACAMLLRQILDTAGLIGPDDAEDTPDLKRRSLAILDVGFGCGDQTWELVRLTRAATRWSRFRYVGLTMNRYQVDTAQRRIYRETLPPSSQLRRHERREVAVDDDGSSGAPVMAQVPPADSFTLFCANAALPDAWNQKVKRAVQSMVNADDSHTDPDSNVGGNKDNFPAFSDRWFLALDCLYHFSPSRKPILQYAANKLAANFMAFDLVLNESASWRDTIIVRAVGLMMGCPIRTFLTKAEYTAQLVKCGYDEDSIIIRDISPHVFPGVVGFLDDQDRALSQYGVSIGGFKLAGRLFDWFGRSNVLKASIVVARVTHQCQE
ncbi:hypothetical protein GMORB2_4199 [Geosmithia morbida]|uniref:Amine oxidase domain-containing protein n=1 Tax=Geosmithia morbida TaxID=1094350 RepID=A0A9P5D8B8_9HYPO|nr:uncharacterized protein GMORB2_4199 [Geosmithia morbida]KAF4125359.1 hypothetical protein GMORB2_4199 [Geosmithia morbida]